MSRFWGPPAEVSELHWRGLVLRPLLEPPADVWPPNQPLMKATLRSGRWEVTPNREGQHLAAWRHRGTAIRSTRPRPEAALEALLLFLREHQEGTYGMMDEQCLSVLETDLKALSDDP